MYVRNLKLKTLVGADLLSLKRSTIGAGGLNFRVRNGNGCTPTARAPTHSFQLFNCKISHRRTGVPYRNCAPFAETAQGLATVSRLSPPPLEHQLTIFNISKFSQLHILWFFHITFTQKLLARYGNKLFLVLGIVYNISPYGATHGLAMYSIPYRNYV